MGQDNVRRTHDLQNKSKITKMTPLGVILVHSSSKISRMFEGSGVVSGWSGRTVGAEGGVWSGVVISTRASTSGATVASGGGVVSRG